MVSLRKKRLVAALQIAVLWVLVLSLAVVAVYAWFFQDEHHDLDIDPSDFGVRITYDGSEQSQTIRYVARAATLFSNPDDEDLFFNSCVSRAEVEVINIGAVDVRASVQIDVVSSSTKDADGNSITAAVGEEYAFKYAIIKKSKAEIDAVTDQYGYTDYRSAIFEQMTALNVSTIEAMNEAALADEQIRHDEGIIFLLAFWTDYFLLLKEYPAVNGGYRQKNSPFLKTTYELLVRVKAEQIENM